MKKKKPDLFDDLMAGLDALREQREGKRTLRTHAVTLQPPVTIKPADLVKVRERAGASRTVFARYLRTNARTLENWEQGRAKPGNQAALLIKLVAKYPDMIERIATIDTPKAAGNHASQ